jgi:hypothetical protein
VDSSPVSFVGVVDEAVVLGSAVMPLSGSESVVAVVLGELVVDALVLAVVGSAESCAPPLVPLESFDPIDAPLAPLPGTPPLSNAHAVARTIADIDQRVKPSIRRR